MARRKNPSLGALQERSTVFTMPLDGLDRRIAKIGGLFDEATALLPGLVQLTTEARRRSRGKLKKGEADAIRAIFATAQRFPELFSVLAAQDCGVDPNTFETPMLLDFLSRLDRVAAVVALVEPKLTLLADTLLRLGELVRPVALDAYDIAKPLAQRNQEVRTLLAPALDYYRGPAKKASATKKAKKKSAGG